MRIFSVSGLRRQYVQCGSRVLSLDAKEQLHFKYYIYIYGNKPPLRNELGLVFRVFGFGGLR